MLAVMAMHIHAAGNIACHTGQGTRCIDRNAVVTDRNMHVAQTVFLGNSTRGAMPSTLTIVLTPKLTSSANAASFSGSLPLITRPDNRHTLCSSCDSTGCGVMTARVAGAAGV